MKNLIQVTFFLAITLMTGTYAFSRPAVPANLPEKGFTAVTDTVMVYGNCGMCKHRIEGAVLKIEGVQTAEWNTDTRLLTVQYDQSAVSLDDIEKKVAEVGHDTDKFRAKDEVYAKLHGCCKYDRPKS